MGFKQDTKIFFYLNIRFKKLSKETEMVFYLKIRKK